MIGEVVFRNGSAWVAYVLRESHEVTIRRWDGTGEVAAKIDGRVGKVGISSSGRMAYWHVEREGPCTNRPGRGDLELIDLGSATRSVLFADEILFADFGLLADGPEIYSSAPQLPSSAPWPKGTYVMAPGARLTYFTPAHGDWSPDGRYFLYQDQASRSFNILDRRMGLSSERFRLAPRVKMKSSGGMLSQDAAYLLGVTMSDDGLSSYTWVMRVPFQEAPTTMTRVTPELPPECVEEAALISPGGDRIAMAFETRIWPWQTKPTKICAQSGLYWKRVGSQDLTPIASAGIPIVWQPDGKLVFEWRPGGKSPEARRFFIYDPEARL